MSDNPFDGKGARSRFAWYIYLRLKKREWFTRTDVMMDKLGIKSSAEFEKRYGSIAKCELTHELTKAFGDIRALVTQKAGEGSIEEEGNNRNKRYRYVGADDDPLSELINYTAIKNVKRYAQFCEDSAGLMPRAWLDYFLEGSADLLKITKRRDNGEQIISSGIDRELKNIELLPMLYEAIREKKVLRVAYKPYDKPEMRLTMHPHILKEHNGRWFLFGHAEDIEPAPDFTVPEFGYVMAIDRIVSEPEATSADYTPAPKGFYANMFRDIIGVTLHEGMKAEDVTVRAYGKTFRYVETKKIHPSQVIVKDFGEYGDGEYGEFRLRVKPNNEFMSSILQWSDGLEVIGPEKVRDAFKRKIEKMSGRYR